MLSKSERATARGHGEAIARGRALERYEVEVLAWRRAYAWANGAERAIDQAERHEALAVESARATRALEMREARSVQP